MIKRVIKLNQKKADDCFDFETTMDFAKQANLPYTEAKRIIEDKEYARKRKYMYIGGLDKTELDKRNARMVVYCSELNQFVFSKEDLCNYYQIPYRALMRALRLNQPLGGLHWQIFRWQTIAHLEPTEFDITKKDEEDEN